jgi:hypothetical protein
LDRELRLRRFNPTLLDFVRRYIDWSLKIVGELPVEPRRIFPRMRQRMRLLERRGQKHYNWSHAPL